MKSNKNTTSLTDHILKKKQGIVATPFNEMLGDKLILNSWSKERMPEYLWLGLILDFYGRSEGFERIYKIIFNISKCIKNLSHPRLSMIFGLSEEDQATIFNIIVNSLERKILAPLTAIYRYSNYPLFNDYFYYGRISFEERVKHLTESTKKYYPPQSNEATDLRNLALSLIMISGRLSIPNELKNSCDAFKEYPYTDHKDEKMKMYRPIIRSMEGNDFFIRDTKFCEKFWRDIGMITPCKPMAISHDENSEKYEKFVEDFKKILNYIYRSNKEKSLSDDKFDVIVGSITYALKIFIEINDKSLGNSILGRHAIRTIIEVYIIMKYLIKRESDISNIWEHYKVYGIGKYKLVLLKARESDLDSSTHFMYPIADALVNEIRWEEFIDVDLKYFDRQNIRSKCEIVDEKELFDIYYDYDTNFVHGFWGAVRESSMLSCDNAEHEYHTVPDLYHDQSLPDVKKDCYKIMKKLLKILKENFDIPDC